MTYKKILSAALAAAMVVGTASVSMASTPDAWIDDSDTIYYLDSNGWLQPSDDYEIKPGESFYIAINHDGTLSSSSAKRYRIYTDWSHGKNYVTDTEIVYKKANKDGTSYTVVATVSGLPAALNSLNKQYSLTGLTAQEANDTNFIKTEVKKLVNAAITDGMRNTIKASLYDTVNGGYKFNNTVYTDEASVLTPANLEKVDTGYSYGGTNYATEDAVVAAITPKTDVTGEYVKDNAVITKEDAITLAGYTLVTQDQVDAGAYYVNDSSAVLANTSAAAATSYRATADKTYYADVDTLKSANSLTITEVTDQAKVHIASDVDGAAVVTDATPPAVEKAEGVIISNNGTSYNWYSTEESALKNAGFEKLDDTAKVAGNLAYKSDEVTKLATSDYIKDNKFADETETTKAADAYKKTGGYIFGNVYVKDDAALLTAAGVTKTKAGYKNKTTNTIYATLTASGTGVEDYNGLVNKTTKAPVTDSEATTAVQNTITSAVNSLGITVNSPEQVQSRSIASKYDYFVEVSTKPDTTAKTFDIVGEVMIGTSKTNAQRYVADVFVTLSNGAYEGGDEVYGDVSIDSTDADSVVKFAKDAGEIYINWGDEAAMIVNVNGQSALNLKYSVRFDSEFADKHGYTNMDFLTFPAEPKFNRTGTFFIYADEDKYIYKKTDSGAEEIPNLKYNDEEEAWEIRTNRLESYVIADDELIMIDDDDNIVAPTPSVPEVPTAPGLKPNPPTGR